MRKTFATSLLILCSLAANALPLVWRADWPGSKPIETLVHRGTDIELEPQWYINGKQAASTNWTFQTFVQTNNQATGEWFGPLPGAAFSHTNDMGSAFYNVMVRAQMPDGAVNYTAFARLRMLDSPGYTPGALPLPVSTIDFSQVVAINAPWLLPGATNDTLQAANAYADRAASSVARSATNYTDAAATLSPRKGPAIWTFNPATLEGGTFSVSPEDFEDIGWHWFLLWSPSENDSTTTVAAISGDKSDTTVDFTIGSYMELPEELQPYYGESVVATLVTPELPGYVLGEQTNAPLASADMSLTNSAAIATINSKIPSAASASNQLADKAWIDDEIDTYAAYYITYTAAGAAFPTRAALTNATVVYSGGVARTPTRNDYAVVLADESHGGAEWRYIYTVAAGATSGQWDAQYPIETNDYDGLSNKPQINGVSLTGNKTGADLGLATPANVAAAALAATNYTDAAAALKSRTALGGFVTSPSTFVDGEETYTSQIPYWDDSGSDGAGWYVYNDGFSRNEFLSDNPNAPILTWSVSMIDYHEFVATRQTVVIPGYILGAQTNKPLASAEMAETNSTAIASLTATVASVAQAATNYTDASISASSPAFSNAVLSVGLGIDTNTVAAINELVDASHDLPVTGVTSVGALLLALAAAVAALKKNLRYSYNAATVSTGTTPTVTNVADRAINTATLGSSVTAATVTLPAATADRARDFFIDLTIEATTAPTMTFIDPATGTTANVAFGADSLADIDTGKNAVLFTEFPNYTWLVSVKHKEAAS